MIFDEICDKNSYFSHPRNMCAILEWVEEVAKETHSNALLFDILCTKILNCRGSWHVNSILFFDYFLPVCWSVWRRASFHVTSFKCLFSRLRSPPLGILNFHWFIVKSIALFALPCLHNSIVEHSSEAQLVRRLNFLRYLEQADLIRRITVLLTAKVVNGPLL